jgi:hypothetical protein
MTYRHLLKALHALGAIGVMGSLAVTVVLVANTVPEPAADYAALRRGIVLINKWLLVPALLLVLVSGLLAIAATEAYKNAGWAWVKALTGILMFEGTLLTVVSSGRQAAEVSATLATIDGSAELSARLAALLRTEWGGLWIMLGLCLANIVLAIWRPRLGRRVRTASQPAD